jgi:hypothetical protein
MTRVMTSTKTGSVPPDNGMMMAEVKVRASPVVHNKLASAPRGSRITLPSFPHSTRAVRVRIDRET